MSAVLPEGEIRSGAFVKEEVVSGGLFCRNGQKHFYCAGAGYTEKQKE
jgi:hypothetical protein